MDFWAENQGHLTPYKFNTVPSRSCTQTYHDRQLAPQFPVYYGDQQHKTMNSGYWPSRDVPNWTNQETANMPSPQNFPFSFGHPVQRHYSDVGEHQRQEARDWATYQQQQQQERGMQCEGWSYNPAHCKRDFSRKNESNFRELEAWALRYSHSLPRRRRIEAELRGARQDNVERRDVQMLNMQDSTQWERASRHQAPNYCQTTPASPSYDVKDKLSYQTKLYSHPPNYNAPPSYSVQYRSVSTLQKFESQNKLPREMFEKCPSKVETQELNAFQVNRQSSQARPSTEAAKVIEGRKFKLNKKAGGMTIFCLVSRIADTEHRSSPVSQKQSDAENPKSSNVSPPLKLADEVDFKIQSPTKHARSPYLKLQAIPICQESLSKIAEKSAPKTNEVSAYEKLAAQSKYPLWRRPSFTSNTETDNSFATCSKDSNSQDKENAAKSSCNVGKESMREAKDDATLMIDTTCVVVKLEVLQGPKKEQVHYLGSENQSALCNQVNPANELDIGPTEDLRTLPEQEAKGNSVDEKALPGNSKSVSETLEERAKRICGLDDSMVQLQEEETVESGVEALKKNDDTNDFKGEKDQKELQDVSTKTANLQQEVSMQTIENDRSKEEEVTGEAGVSKENIEQNGKDLEKDSKIQNSEMADDLVQESNGEEAVSEQCEESVEIDHSTDDNEVLPSQIESPLQVSKQNGQGLAEFDENIESFGVSENNTMQFTQTEENGDFLPDNDLNFKDENQDQEAKDKVNEGDFDQQNTVEKLANCELGELSDPELESSQRDEVSWSNSGNNDGVKDSNASEMKSLQQLDSGQLEDMPDLETLSESTQNQNKQLTEESNDKTQGSNIVETEFEPKVEVSCIKEDINNSDKDMEVATRDLEIQETAEKDIEGHSLQKRGEGDATNDATCGKEQSDAMEQVQVDILAALDFKDFEQETQLDLTDGLKEHFQFGCHEKALVKEERLHDKDSFENELPSVNVSENQDNEQPTVIDPEQILPEDVEQSQDKEVKDTTEEGQADQGPCADVSPMGCTTSYSELCDEVMLNDNTQNEKERDDICTKGIEILEKSLENAETSEKLHKDEKVETIESIQVRGTADATCVKEKLGKDAAFLVADDEQAKEGQILVEFGKGQDFDLQQCQWEDALSKSSVKEQEFFKDDEKSDQDTKNHQFTDKDEEVRESCVVCHSDPNVNHAAILERSSSKSIPSTSMFNNNFESASCEEEGKYPKSLWDAVNRIRKHTAPDSENEEEEVTDSWDRESLSDTLASYGHVFDQGYRDITEEMQADAYYEDLNAQDDTLSQCSGGSQESDGTIVDDELEDWTNSEATAISNESQGSDGEETGEIEPQNGDAVNKTGQIEERVDEESVMPDEIML